MQRLRRPIRQPLRSFAVAQVVGYGLLYSGRSRKDLEELMHSKLKEERMKLERLSISASIGA